MKKNIKQVVARIRAEKTMRRRMLSFVTALAVLVSGNVFWALHETGTAMTDPWAGQEPPDTQALDLEEGIALDAPPGENDSGGEEVTLDLTGMNLRERVACIAASQVGCSESKTDFTIDPQTGAAHGWTLYGNWYGNPYGDWNAMFTYYCLNLAGAEDIPVGGGCWAWSVTLEDAGLLLPADETDPERGDILLFDTDKDGQADRCGILTSKEESLLNVVEGDLDGTVGETFYFMGDDRIIGCVSLAEAESDEPVPDVQPVIAQSDGDEQMVEFHEQSPLGVAVDAFAMEGTFPEGTFMSVTDVPHKRALEVVSDSDLENKESVDAIAIDISFFASDGRELEPDSGVQVQITLPEEMKLSGEEYSLLHVSDEGDVTTVENAEVFDAGATFEAESFSLYVLATMGSSGSVPYLNYNLDHVTHYYFYEDSAFSSNSADTPFIVYVGDTLTVGGENTFTEVGNWSHGNHILMADFGSFGTSTATDRDGVEHTVYTRTYVGQNPGSLYIEEANTGKRFYIAVHDPIMVKSAHGYKQRDRIREHLFDWQVDKDGYIPNRKSYPYYLTYDPQSPNNNADETVTFYTKSYNANETFRFYNGDTANPTQIYPSGAVVSRPTGPDADGKYTYTVTLTATEGDLANNGYIRAVFSENNEEFWIRVWRQRVPGEDDGPGQELTHADMEIADGGSYTVSSTYYEGDTCYVDVMYYQADVTAVNDAFVYLYDGYYIDYSKPEHEVRYFKDETKHFSTADGDYERNGEPGSTQYEYTSAWIANNQFNVRRGKHYDATQAESATFDVNLELTPKKKMTYRVDQNGNLILESTDNNWTGNPGEDNTREHVVFKLDHQDVIDARNKCPMNNGLDFTAKAEYTVLKLPVYKDMVNGTIADGQFTYDIIDLNTPSLFSTPDNIIYPGLHNENNIEFPDVSEGAQIFHKYKAFEVFNADGTGWGGGVNGADLMNELQHAYLSNNDQPFANCTSAADVFQIVNNPATDSEIKELFNKTASNQRNGSYAGNAPDGKHFANTTQGYYVLVDDAKIGESSSVSPDNDARTHGVAMFENMRLVVDPSTDQADYYFAIHEREPIDCQGVEYDQKLHYFKVHVEKKNSGTGEEYLVAKVIFLQDNGSHDPKTMAADATIRDLTFSNELLTYTLPDTGGHGTLPYAIGGTTLIGTALLLLRRRRKGEG